MFSKKTVIAGVIFCLFLFSPVTMAKEVVVQEARDGVVVVDTDSIYEIERGRFNTLKPTWNNTWREPIFQRTLLACIPYLKKGETL